jgi:peptidoglycan/xylan/chitin deacetylase (PgdA/CDA1 family)
MSSVHLSIDLEHDCLPYLGTRRGLDEGMSRLLDLLADLRVTTTVFCTGTVLEERPNLVTRVVDLGHRLGCHSLTHPNFGRLGAREAEAEIGEAIARLREVAPVRSFRAPYLTFPDRFVPILAAHGVELDSSQARYKPRTLRGHPDSPDLIRVPASVPPSLLRAPGIVRDRILGRLSDPVVLFVHPWEFVDFRDARIPWDSRFGTGDGALDALREVVGVFRGLGREFAPLETLLPSGEGA